MNGIPLRCSQDHKQNFGHYLFLSFCLHLLIAGSTRSNHFLSVHLLAICLLLHTKKPHLQSHAFFNYSFISLLFFDFENSNLCVTVIQTTYVYCACYYLLFYRGFHLFDFLLLIDIIHVIIVNIDYTFFPLLFFPIV